MLLKNLCACVQHSLRLNISIMSPSGEPKVGEGKVVNVQPAYRCSQGKKLRLGMVFSSFSYTPAVGRARL